MPKEMYVEEHPEGPRLKAFIHRRLYEEEEGNDVQEVTSSGGMPAAYPGESDRVKTRAAQSGGEETSKSVDDRAAPSPRGR